jgi:hypothetical protein
MEQISPSTRARTIVGVVAAVLLVMSFALVATLINRQQANVGPAASGCPSTSGKVASSIVSAHFTTSSSTATYFFDSLVNESPSGGVPGLVEYCVYYSGSDPTNVTASAVGDDSTPFVAGTPPPSGSFSFQRGPGGPSGNIGLDGATHTMGTATWAGSVPSPTFLLHISDADECHRLYGAGTPDTCFVFPSSSATPTATATPPNGPTVTPTTPGGPTATPTNTPPPGSTPTPTIIPTPTGTPHPK